MKFCKSKKRITAYVLLALCAATTAYAATEHWNDASLTPQAVVATQAGDQNWEQWKSSWETIKTDFEQVSLAPGKDASQMNLAWYSKEQAKNAEVRISTHEDMSGASEFRGTSKEGTVVAGTQYYTNKVTVRSLKPDTTYYYQVKINGDWKPVESFKTGNPDDFSFMYVGDPQIGASKGQTSSEGNKQDGELAARNDAYNWNKTLNSALSLRAESTDSVTTVDLLTLSLQTLEGELYKYGAAPSYLKRGGTVRRVTCSCLPAGLQEGSPPPEATHIKLSPGCFFVMLSDGVADSLDDEWLQNLLAGWEGHDPQQLVAAILADSMEKRGGTDDAGVLALYIPEGSGGAQAV